MQEYNFTKIKTEVINLKMKKSEKYNGSGCLDMTAFIALKNIERERAKNRTGVLAYPSVWLLQNLIRFCRKARYPRELFGFQ